MKVSVALAAFNGGQFIGEQLRSLAAQTRLPDELVVSDDNSSDDTVGLVDNFGRHAPFEVKIIRNESNVGLVRNFETAISRCSGDVIFLSDQDDVWHTDKISRVLEQFQRSPSIQVVTNDEVMTDTQLRPLGTTRLENLRAMGLSPDAMMTGCCTALTAQWRGFCLPFPPDVKAHDLWIGTLAQALGVRDLLEVPLQSYRRHGGNVTSSVLNSGTVTLRKMAIDGLTRDGAGGWPKDTALLTAVIERLATPGALQFASAEAIARAIDEVRDKKAAIERRMAAVRLPKLIRPLALGRNWMRRDYRYFLGMKSFVKDIIR